MAECFEHTKQHAAATAAGGLDATAAQLKARDDVLAAPDDGVEEVAAADKIGVEVDVKDVMPDLTLEDTPLQRQFTFRANRMTWIRINPLGCLIVLGRLFSAQRRA